MVFMSMAMRVAESAHISQSNMLCPRCKELCYIEVAEDSYYKIIKCPRCLWQTWLKNLC